MVIYNNFWDASLLLNILVSLPPSTVHLRSILSEVTSGSEVDGGYTGRDQGGTRTVHEKRRGYRGGIRVWRVWWAGKWWVERLKMVDFIHHFPVILSLSHGCGTNKMWDEPSLQDQKVTEKEDLEDIISATWGHHQFIICG